MARVPLKPEMISIGNCPKCRHFPTQFVAVEGGEDYYIHLPNAPHCDVRSAGDRVQELEDAIAQIEKAESEKPVFFVDKRTIENVRKSMFRNEKIMITKSPFSRDFVPLYLHSSVSAPEEVDLAGLVGDVLQAMAEVASEQGPLSADDIRDAIPMMVQLMMMKGEGNQND